jgi:hypothetical protein
LTHFLTPRLMFIQAANNFTIIFIESDVPN